VLQKQNKPLMGFGNLQSDKSPQFMVQTFQTFKNKVKNKTKEDHIFHLSFLKKQSHQT